MLAFPDMFPTGVGGYERLQERETKLPLRKYYQQPLLNIDGQFVKNIEYLFCAQYSTDIKQTQSDWNIALHLKWGKTCHGEKVTAGMLKNPQQPVCTEHAYKFLKQVIGSPGY